MKTISIQCTDNWLHAFYRIQPSICKYSMVLLMQARKKFQPPPCTVISLPPPSCPWGWVVRVVGFTKSTEDAHYSPQGEGGDEDEKQADGKQPQGIDGNLGQGGDDTKLNLMQARTSSTKNLL